MKEQNDVTKLEFLMTVNDNIIVQRFFNVRNYVSESRNSVDFKEYMDDLKLILISNNVIYPLYFKLFSYSKKTKYSKMINV